MFRGHERGNKFTRRISALVLALALVLTGINVDWTNLMTSAAAPNGDYVPVSNGYWVAQEYIAVSNSHVDRVSMQLSAFEEGKVFATLEVYKNAGLSMDPSAKLGGPISGSQILSITQNKDGSLSYDSIYFDIPSLINTSLVAGESLTFVVQFTTTDLSDNPANISLKLFTGAGTGGQIYDPSAGYWAEYEQQMLSPSIQPGWQSGGVTEEIPSVPSDIYLAPGQQYQLDAGITNREVTYTLEPSTATAYGTSVVNGFITAGDVLGTATVNIGGSGVQAGHSTTVHVVNAVISSPTTYTGAQISPAVTVYDTSSTTITTNSSDYFAVNSTGKEAGTYNNVSVSGYGAYSTFYQSGLSYQIDQLSLNDATTTNDSSGTTLLKTAIENGQYTINPGTHTMTAGSFSWNGNTYVLGRDFQAVCIQTTKEDPNDRTAYAYNITIYGMQNFKGSYGPFKKTIRGNLSSIDINTVYKAGIASNKVLIGSNGYAEPSISFYEAIPGATPGTYTQGARIPQPGDVIITIGNNVSLTPEGAQTAATAPGSAMIRITSPLYIGQIDIPFTVVQDLSAANVTLEKNSYVFDGNPKTPLATVELYGTPLNSATDYEIRYRNNTAAGVATAIIVGKGNYIGEVVVPFRIVDNILQNAMVVIGSIPTVNGVPDESYYGKYDSAIGGFATKHMEYYTGSQITIKKEDIHILIDNGDGTRSDVKASDFAFQATPYGTNTVVGERGGQINLVMTGYADQEIVVYFKIEPCPVDKNSFRVNYLAAGCDAARTYTGSNLSLDNGGNPFFTVKGTNGNTLSFGTDYTTSYNAVNATVPGQVTITGTGNYQGSFTADFIVLPKNIGDSDVTLTAPLGTVSYNGGNPANITKDAINLSYNGNALINNSANPANDDFEVICSKNNFITTSAKKAEAKIIGKGNYKGERIEYYDIVSKSILNGSVSITFGGQNINDMEVDAGGNYIATYPLEYNGLVQTASGAVDIKDNGSSINYPADYSILVGRYNTNAADTTSPNAPTITIKGRGNYATSGNPSVVIKFTIKKRDITDTYIKISHDANSGKNFKVTDDKNKAHNTLIRAKNDDPNDPNADYYIVFSPPYNENDEKGGDYIAQVIGINNYEGTVEEPFSVGTSMSNAYIAVQAPYASLEKEASAGYRYPMWYAGIAPTITVKTASSSATAELGTEYTIEVSKDGGAAIEVSDADAYAAAVKNAGLYDITVKGTDDGLFYGSRSFRIQINKQNYDKDGTGTRENEAYPGGTKDLYTILKDGGSVSGTNLGTFYYGAQTIALEVEFNPVDSTGIPIPTAKESYTIGAVPFVFGTDSSGNSTAFNTTIVKDNKQVIIKGEGGNFTGSRTYTYDVKKRIFGNCEVETTPAKPSSGNITFDYTGSPQAPQINSVKYSLPSQGIAEETLVASTGTRVGDYKVTYETEARVPLSGPPSLPGKYRLVLEGEYASEKYDNTKIEIEFSIVQKDISTATLTTDPSETDSSGNVIVDYTGSPVAPEAKIAFGGVQVPTTEYKIKYVSVPAGIYDDTIKPTAEGSYKMILDASASIPYTGTKEVPFVIKKPVFSTSTITVSPAGPVNYTYNGKRQVPPVPTVTYKGKLKLTEGIDYTIYYAPADTWSDERTALSDSDPIGVGNYALVVECKGKYVADTTDTTVPTEEQGKVRVLFNINAKDISTSGITATLSGGNTYEYKGASTPAGIDASTQLSVRYDEHPTPTLVKATDYDFKYAVTGNTPAGNITSETAPPTKPGNYEVVITGKGNYSGSRTLPFYIRANINSSKFEIEGISDGQKFLLKNGKLKKITLKADNIDFDYDTDSSDKDPANLKSWIIINELTTTGGTKTKTPIDTNYYDISITNSLTGLGHNKSITITGKASEGYTGSKTFGNISVYGDIQDVVWSNKTLDPDDTTGQRAVMAYTGAVVNPTTDAIIQYAGQTLVANADYKPEPDTSAKEVTGGTGSDGIYKFRVKGTANGLYKGTAKEFDFAIRYDLSKAAITVTNYKNAYTGSAIKLDPVVKIGSKPLTAVTDYTFDYASTDNACILPGIVTINVDRVPNKSINNGSVSYEIVSASGTSGTFTITDPGMSSADPTRLDRSYPYTGSKIIPEINSVSYKPTGRTSTITLIKDLDYTVDSDNSVNVTDNARVYINGTGNYSGLLTMATFSITKKDIGGGTVTPTYDLVVDYTAGGAKPTYSLVDSGVDSNGVPYSYNLREGIDFTVDYKNAANQDTNTNVRNDAQINFRGIGNYTGVLTRNFAINKVDASKITVTVDPVTYTGSEISRDSLNVLVDGIPIGNTDYRILDVKSASVAGAGQTIRDAGLYEIEVGVPSTSGVAGNYTTDRVKATLEVKPRELSKTSPFIFDPKLDEKNYKDSTTGNMEVSFALTKPFSYNGTGLEKDKDYTVTYTDADHAGTNAKATFTGIGNFTGTIDYTYSIGKDISTLPKSELRITLSQTSDLVYDGTEKVASVDSVSVLEDGKWVVLGKNTGYVDQKDPDLDYKTAGEKYLLITAGTLNSAGEIVPGRYYYGTVKSPTYRVNKSGASNLRAYINPSEFNAGDFAIFYTGAQIRPEVIVVDLDGNELVLNKDYSVTYGTNKAAGYGVGSFKVNLLSTSNYSGASEQIEHENEGKFDIIGANGDGSGELNITLKRGQGANNDEYVINVGNKAQPDIEVTYEINGRSFTLKKGTDYEAKYYNSSVPGQAQVVVVGRGSFEGAYGTADYRILGNLASLTDKYVSIPKADNALTFDRSKVKVFWDKDTQLTAGLDYDCNPAPLNGNMVKLVIDSVYGSDYVNSYTKIIDVTRGQNDPPDVPPGPGGDDGEGGGDGGGGGGGTTPPTSGQYTVVLSNADGNYYYTGRPMSVTGTVTDTSTGKTVTPSSWVYEPANPTNPGVYTAYAVVNGKRSTGVTFRIIKSLTESTIKATITGGYTQTYDGTTKRPSVTVVDTSTGRTLIENTDYIVSYINNIGPGKAYVRVQGIGNYTNTRSEEFTIVSTSSGSGSGGTGGGTGGGTSGGGTSGGGTTGGSQGSQSSPTPLSGTVRVTSAGSQTINIGWTAAADQTAYKIYRSTNPNSYGTMIAMVPKNTSSYVDNKGITSGVTYYYRIRPVVIYNGTYVHGSYSSASSVTAR